MISKKAIPIEIFNDVIMRAMASQITSLTIVYSTVYSGADQRKHQSSASLAFVRGIYRWPVNSPHKGPVTRKIFPFDSVIMNCKQNIASTIENIITAQHIPHYPARRQGFSLLTSRYTNLILVHLQCESRRSGNYLFSLQAVFEGAAVFFIQGIRTVKGVIKKTWTDVNLKNT